MDLPKKPDGNLDGFSTVSSSTRVFWNSRRRSGFIWKKKIVQLHGGGGGGVDFLGTWVSGRWVSDKFRDTHDPIPG
ncbi:hypothetical protein CK203_113636 [Vitis vinifera]|uniref:Uncharacterized protein n=1 Tax=Vitis vinifera TaxID=29760 RepID=A0A438FET6_VITVI|nr:hypothetical protein CK203_113636 [Vitis vinifera]